MALNKCKHLILKIQYVLSIGGAINEKVSVANLDKGRVDTPK